MTMVSAARTGRSGSAGRVAPRRVATASHFAAATRRTYSRGCSSGSGVSSTLAGVTSSTRPSWPSSSRRRGDADASTRSATTPSDMRGLLPRNGNRGRPTTPPMPRHIVLLLVTASWLGACAPETDLTSLSPAGDGAPGPGGPAGATLVDPVAGATDVPLNLAAV